MVLRVVTQVNLSTIREVVAVTMHFPKKQENNIQEAVVWVTTEMVGMQVELDWFYCVLRHHVLLGPQ